MGLSIYSTVLAKQQFLLHFSQNMIDIISIVEQHYTGTTPIMYRQIIQGSTISCSISFDRSSYKLVIEIIVLQYKGCDIQHMQRHKTHDVEQIELVIVPKLLVQLSSTVFFQLVQKGILFLA